MLGLVGWWFAYWFFLIIAFVHVMVLTCIISIVAFYKYLVCFKLYVFFLVSEG